MDASFPYGPYHRLASPTQTYRDVVRQVESGELWGTTPRWGGAPSVQAYFGRLPSDEHGIEFYAMVPHTHHNMFNHQVAWCEDDPGVLHKMYDQINNRDYVGIRIKLSKIMQDESQLLRKS